MKNGTYNDRKEVWYLMARCDRAAHLCPRQGQRATRCQCPEKVVKGLDAFGVGFCAHVVRRLMSEAPHSRTEWQWRLHDKNVSDLVPAQSLLFACHPGFPPHLLLLWKHGISLSSWSTSSAFPLSSLLILLALRWSYLDTFDLAEVLGSGCGHLEVDRKGEELLAAQSSNGNSHKPCSEEDAQHLRTE